MALRETFRRSTSESGCTGSKARNLMADSSNQGASLKRQMGLIRTTAILIGCSFGTSIYTMPSIVFRNADSVGAALMIWLLAGAEHLLSGLCYMELATMLPASGGGYAYVTAGSKSLGRFGDFIPFMYVWTHVILVDALLTSLQAQIFASYILSIPYPGCVPPYAAKLLLAQAFTCLVTAVNCFSTKIFSRVQGFLSLFTCAILISIIITGFISASVENHLYDASFFRPETTAGKLAVAFFGSQLTTGGWVCITNFAGEMSNPSRNIPLALSAGMLVVTLIVFLFNLCLCIVIDAKAMASTEVIVVTFVAATWGKVAASLMPVVISIGVFGTACALFFANSRVMQAAARKRHFPGIFSMVNINTGVSLTSMLFRALLAILYTFLGSITFLTEALPLLIALSNLLVFGSFFVLRVSMRDAPRPYRVPTMLAVVRVLTLLFLLGVRFVQPVAYLPFAFLAGGLSAGGIYYVAFVRFRLTLPGAITFNCFFKKLLNSYGCFDESDVMLHENM